MWRLMNVMLDLVAHSWTAVEGQIHQPKHVEGSHQRREVPDYPEQAICPAFRGPGLPQDLVFGKESRKGWNAGDGERGDEHGPVCNRNAPMQVAHVAHVLLATHGMNHRSGPKEEQGFEERMSEDMKHAC